MKKSIIAIFAFIFTAAPTKSQITFDLIKKCPNISDTTAFIKKLVQKCNLYVFENSVQKRLQKISYYKKIKLNGSNKEYVLLEYDYGDGAMASYPWKYQLLFTKEGRLLKTFDAKRFELLAVFPKQNPYLLTVVATSKGNGGHELYRLHADTLENIYDGIDDYRFRTYDAHQDNSVNEPTELSIKIIDNNRDGFNDLVFQGMFVLIQKRDANGNWNDGETVNGKTITYSVDKPFKKIPVKYIFLYNKRTGHFRAKENYIEKYKLYFY